MNPHEILKRHQPTRDNLLMILHDLQDNHPENYLPEPWLTEVAQYLNLTQSAVYGVVSYYSMFSLKPRGRYLVRVCVSPVCQLLKAEGLIAMLERELGIRCGETTPDGLFTLETAECLGQCQEAPSMMINREVHNQVDAQRIAQIIAQYRAKQK